MDQPFSSARLLLEGAKESIDAFDSIASDFIHPDNRTFIQEFDPKTRKDLLKVRFKTDFPAKLALQAKRVFGELRDALDHALYASAQVTTRKPDPKRCKFPFGDTPAAIEKEIIERCDDLHADVLKIVIANAPHEAGNRTLWAMNKVRNRDSHKILSPSVAVSRGIGITTIMGGGTFDTFSEWRATQRELHFGRMRLFPNSQVQINPVFQIGLDTAFGFGNDSAVAVFKNTHAVVTALVDQIENATIRTVR
jgi:hypothetical protein